MTSTRLELSLRARAAAVLFVFRLAAGFVVAYPAASAFGVFGAAPFADGDRALFQAGGVHLVEALRFGARTLSAAVGGASLALLVLSFAGLLPLAAALTSLTRPGASVARSFGLAIPLLPAFAFFTGAAWLLRALYAVAALAVLSAAAAVTKSVVDERAADLIVVVVGAVLALGLAALDVFHDLSRAAVTRFDEAPKTAMLTALRTVSALPGRVALAAASPACAALALVGVGSALTALADVARPGGGRVAAVFLVHQAVVFGVAFARVHWLAAALELVAEVRLRAGGAAGASGESGLLVDLDVPPSGAIPGEIQAHDPAP